MPDFTSGRAANKDASEHKRTFLNLERAVQSLTLVDEPSIPGSGPVDTFHHLRTAPEDVDYDGDVDDYDEKGKEDRGRGCETEDSPSATKGGTAAKISFGNGTPAPNLDEELKKFLAECPRSSESSSAATSLPTYPLLSTRISMARLLAARVLISQALDYTGLEPEGRRTQEQPLKPFVTELQLAGRLIRDVVTDLANSKLVRDYEIACMSSEGIVDQGRRMSRFATADMAGMLCGVKGVIDAIMRERR